jgi:hypothetical protein
MGELWLSTLANFADIVGTGTGSMVGGLTIVLSSAKRWRLN